jgi:uncharacterized protein YukE
MTRAKKPTAPAALRNQIAVHAGQISALIADLAGVKARLDELESWWRKSLDRYWGWSPLGLVLFVLLIVLFLG